jgi:hypothetical protein
MRPEKMIADLAPPAPRALGIPRSADVRVELEDRSLPLEESQDIGGSELGGARRSDSLHVFHGRRERGSTKIDSS